MGMFLNSKVPYEAFKKIRQETYFVDKTLILDELVPSIGKNNCYLCITRPRRFGKTVTAYMTGAFLGKTNKQDQIFDGLAISQKDSYVKHLNRHDVIYIDFSKMPKDCSSYEQYINRIQNGIAEDLVSTYPGCDINSDEAVWDILQKIYEKTEDQFLFVIDEWDAVFHMSFVTKENQQNYLLFLRNMLKDQPYVELAYMTGVLPIAKYSSGSQLNMFVEYDMASSSKFSEYFGFSDEETDRLYRIYEKQTEMVRFTREDLKIWYDGYHTVTGKRLYNPRSVVLALADNQLRNMYQLAKQNTAQ